MKKIHSSMLEVNQPMDWEVEQKHIGRSKNRIVIVRNFFKNPNTVRAVAKDLEYFSTLDGEYSNLPGFVHNLSGLFRKELYAPLSYACKNYFEASMEINKNYDLWRLNFQQYDVEEKSRYCSLVPHVDSMRYAAVLSLNTDDEYDGDTNSTAFYRSVETGEEFTSFDKNYRMERLLDKTQVKVEFDPSLAKFKAWERYHVEQHELNKLIIYEGNMWHSPYFEKKLWRSNRLTFNAFIQ